MINLKQRNGTIKNEYTNAIFIFYSLFVTFRYVNSCIAYWASICYLKSYFGIGSPVKYMGIMNIEKIESMPNNLKDYSRNSKYIAESVPQISMVSWSSISIIMVIQSKIPPLLQTLLPSRDSRISIYLSNTTKACSFSISLIFSITESKSFMISLYYILLPNTDTLLSY